MNAISFPTQKHESRSEKYTVIDSNEIIRLLQGKGFELQSVKRGKRGQSSLYGRHIVTMTNPDFPKIEGDGEFTLVFTNSYDGSTRFNMAVGYFRIVCGNGMIIMNRGEKLGAIKHIGYTPEEVYQECLEIVAQAVEAEKRVRKARTIQVDRLMALELVDRLKPLVENRVKGTVISADLFHVNREADNGTDLWSILNVAQENLLRGMRVVVMTEKGLKARKLRSVENTPAQVQKVNTAIAELLEELTA